ncbi:MAG TPA: helix-turn-helix domain-containing protein [Conexibacter sp.]|nr:helix-turn-helix domain-containing protein [Conexibacter sp.]
MSPARVLVAPLQEIADAAADELRRPVVLDDRWGRLLAHSAHGDGVDAVRLATIRKQVLEPAVLAWIDAHGVASARHAVRVPPNPALAMDARVCAPIRCGGRLLGHVWLIDRGESLTDAQLRRLEQLAGEAGVALHRDLLARHARRSRTQELVRDLLADDRRDRHAAAWELVELELVEHDGPSVVLVVVPQAPDGALDGAVLDAAVDRVCRRLGMGAVLQLVRPGHVALVVSRAEPGLRGRAAAQLAAHVGGAVAAVLNAPADAIRVAIGGDVERLGEAHASYRQALHAARIAGLAQGRFGAVVSWSELGVYRLVAELSLEQLDPAVLHSGLPALLASRETQVLAHTLECYLDNAGDASATAAALRVHRTTLHHRLRRLEELGGIDVADGEQRLTLHLGLKLARLRPRT